MTIIELDASKWVRPADFFGALLPRLGAPLWHGQSLDALNDSIFSGDINAIDPPFHILVNYTSDLNDDMRNFFRRVETMIDEGRMETGREARIEFHQQL